MPPIYRLLLSALITLSSTQSVAQDVHPLPGITAAAVGNEHACAISQARVWCWGRNDEGQLGTGDRHESNLATPVVDLPVVPTAIAVGHRHTCAIGDGQLYCWGDNRFGQLGTGDLTTRDRPVLIALPGDAAVPVSGVALGRWHACASRGNELYCWGRNEHGQTGQPALTAVDGDPAASAQPIPRPALSLADSIERIALGEAFSCAAGPAGVLCWGDNAHGELGDGSVEPRHAPARVFGIDDAVIELAAGDGHACARDAQGVSCWGRNDSGQVGVEPARNDPSTLKVTRPQRVGGLDASIGLALGAASSCAAVGREVRCWGVDPLADRDFPPVPYSAAAVTLFQLQTEVVAVSGRGTAVCAQTPSGRLLCVGTAQLIATGQPLDPMQAVPVDGVVHRGNSGGISLGGDFGCMTGEDGHPLCWGDNSRGQLGQGDLAPRDGAVTIESLAPSRVHAGHDHACTRQPAQLTAACWGANDRGALGDGSLVDSSLPVDATAIGSRRNLALGDGFSCNFEPLTETFRCIGNNDRGQLGIPPSAAPVLDAQSVRLPLVEDDQGPGTQFIEQLVVGTDHGCAATLPLIAASRTWCWGLLATDDAEVDAIAAGHPDSNMREVVLADAGGTLLSGPFTACRWSTDHAQLHCWGRDFASAGAGQRGEHRAPHALDLPVADDGVPFRHLVALGGRHVCAATVDGRIRCIGLPGRSCAFEQATGRIVEQDDCAIDEAALDARERGWLDVRGLPRMPVDELAAGDQHACARMGRRTYCWGHNDSGQLGRTTHALFTAPVEIQRDGAITPAPRLPVTVDPALGCPGYYVGAVSLLEPLDADAAGGWGLELLLSGSNLRLHGGLNFGGVGSADSVPPTPGYAAFSILSPQGSQRVNLHMSGNGEFVLRVGSSAGGIRRNVLTETLVLGEQPITRSVDLDNGFHVVSLQPTEGQRRFAVSAATTTLAGGPASFHGGAVVGGYLEGRQSGFAAVCTSSSQELRFHTESRGLRGPSGAGDLRLRVSEGQTRTLLYDSAGE